MKENRLEQLNYTLRDIYVKEQALLEEFRDIKREIESLRYTQDTNVTRLKQRLKDNITNRKALEKELRDAYKVFNGVSLNEK